MRRTFALTVACTFLIASCDLPDTSLDADSGTGSSGGITIERDTRDPLRSPLADVIERVLPSVVNVRVRGAVSDPFTGERSAGEGSGVVIGEEGVILTNYHVVADALEVRVVFTDDREPVSGQVVGIAPDKDLAVIRVDADDLEPLTVGSSERLRLGDTVAAIGFPLRLGETPTVTQGIVSGIDRSVQVPSELGEVHQLEPLLQTDAAINPGNSGGALIDRSGRLVGINTAAAQASAAENVGFAIAIDDALPVVDRILAESGQRAGLGVSIQPLTPDIAVDLGIDESLRGVVIAGLFAGPAEEAGLEPGDVIVELDGRSVTSPDDVGQVLEEFAPGDRIEVGVVSPQGRREVSVELGFLPVIIEPE